jgi:hypothetical protein
VAATKEQQAWNARNSEQFPIAVPDLRIAARLLGRPLDQVQDAAQGDGFLVYESSSGTEYFSLHQLARALGLVESRETREAQRRAPERAAS